MYITIFQQKKNDKKISGLLHDPILQPANYTYFGSYEHEGESEQDNTNWAITNLQSKIC